MTPAPARPALRRAGQVLGVAAVTAGLVTGAVVVTAPPADPAATVVLLAATSGKPVLPAASPADAFAVPAPPPPPPPPPAPEPPPAPAPVAAPEPEAAPAAAPRASRSAPAPAPAPAPAASAARVPAPPPPPPPAPPVSDGSYAGQLLSGVNAQRAAAGLPALQSDGCATARATEQSQRMARDGAMSHQSMGAVLSSCGGSKAAENVAYGAVSASRIVELWMGSSGHRANILDPALTHVGTAAVQTADGTWWPAQVFLSR